MEIKVNTHGGKVDVPVSHGEWIDLMTAEDVMMEQFDFKLIDLGISMELPEGYYAVMVPRSSTYKNYGVIMTNSVGIIENDYNGDNDIWKFPALAFKSTFIPKGIRICQFTLVPKSRPVRFKEVESLGNQDRGGFGSTGK